MADKTKEPPFQDIRLSWHLNKSDSIIWTASVYDCPGIQVGEAMTIPHSHSTDPSRAVAKACKMAYDMMVMMGIEQPKRRRR